MFTGISWGTYFIGLVLLTAVWYTFVLLRYYQPELKNFLHKNKKAQGLPTDEPASNFFIEDKPGTTPAGTFSDWQDTSQEEEVSQLMRRIKEIIVNAAQNPFNKEEFTKYLSLLFRDFSSLKDTSYRGAINEFTANTCTSKALPLTQEDVDVLW
jgi:hypothetical protein